MDLIKIKIRRFKELLTGILLGSGTNWSLIRYNAVDYVLDGYSFINNRCILYKSKVEENTIQHKILSLKNKAEKSPIFENNNILDNNTLLFSVLQREKELLAICLHSEDVIYVGRVKEVFSKSFGFDTYDTELQKSGIINIEYSKVRYIQIRTDYLNSLCLLLDEESSPKVTQTLD